MANRGDGAQRIRAQEAVASADALDDNFALSSEDEGAGGGEPLVFLGDSDDEPEDDDRPAAQRAAKRKAPPSSNAGATSKKRKSRGKKFAAFDCSTASADDFVAWFKHLLRTRKGLSALEADELGFGADSFQDTSSFDGVRGLAGFHSFVEFCMGGDAERLKKPPLRKKACRPVVLVVCTSAIRAANLVKALDDFRKNCTVAKLFAKHMKIDDQVNFLKSSPVNIAVGNPNRLIKLFELGALQTDRLLKIIVDSTHKDQKGLTIWDVNECQNDLMDLFTKHFTSRLKDGSAKIVCF